MDEFDAPAYPWGNDGCMVGGLTKREMCVFMAMQGLLANSFDGNQNQPLSTASYEDIADIAVDHAEAVLKRLKGEGK